MELLVDNVVDVDLLVVSCLEGTNVLEGVTFVVLGVFNQKRIGTERVTDVVFLVHEVGVMEGDLALIPSGLVLGEVQLHIGHMQEVAAQYEVIACCGIKDIGFDGREAPGVTEFRQGKVM